MAACAGDGRATGVVSGERVPTSAFEDAISQIWAEPGGELNSAKAWLTAGRPHHVVLPTTAWPKAGDLPIRLVGLSGRGGLETAGAVAKP